MQFREESNTFDEVRGDLGCANSMGAILPHLAPKPLNGSRWVHALPVATQKTGTHSAMTILVRMS